MGLDRFHSNLRDCISVNTINERASMITLTLAFRSELLCVFGKDGGRAIKMVERKSTVEWHKRVRMVGDMRTWFAYLRTPDQRRADANLKNGQCVEMPQAH